MLTARILRRAVAAFAVLTLAALLPGCVPLVPPTHRPSHNITAVEAQLTALPGVVAAHINGGPVGLPGQNSVGLSVELVPGYPGDLAELLRYMVEAVWSCTNVDHPSTTVDIAIGLGDQPADVVALAAQLGWKAYVVGYKTSFRVDDVEQLYGPWPGAVPSPPAKLTSVVVPTPTPTPTP